MKPKKHATSITLPSSLLIDSNREPLKCILSPYRGLTHVPSELDGTALMVFIELNKCFEEKKQVSEGLLNNVMWGLELAGYDPRHVASGLSELRRKSYIYYSDAQGQKISDQTFDKKVPLWIRYDKKFTSLFIKNDNSGLIFPGGVIR